MKLAIRALSVIGALCSVAITSVAIHGRASAQAEPSEGLPYEIAKEEGSREAQEWMWEGGLGNEEQHEALEMMQSEARWGTATEPQKESAWQGVSEEIRENGGATNNGAQEGRMEYLRSHFP